MLILFIANHKLTLHKVKIVSHQIDAVTLLEHFMYRREPQLMVKMPWLQAIYVVRARSRNKKSSQVKSVTSNLPVLVKFM